MTPLGSIQSPESLPLCEREEILSYALVGVRSVWERSHLDVFGLCYKKKNIPSWINNSWRKEKLIFKQEFRKKCFQDLTDFGNI